MRRLLLASAAGLASCLAGCAKPPPADRPGAVPQAGRAATDQGVATPGGLGTSGWQSSAPGGPAPPQLAPPGVTRAPRP